MATKIPIDTQELAVKVLRQVDGMRKVKKHCDFLVKVGSEEIPAHRNILSAHSDYFDAMFSHPTVENKSGVIVMMGVDPECAVVCVDHMYGKEVSILPEKYEPLIYVAALMQLHKLRDAIVSLVEANLDPKSFFFARRIASMYGCKNLEQKCKEFADENLGLISMEEEFGELDKSDIKRAIRSKNVKISEEEKLDALVRWVKHDSKNNDLLLELVKCVNLQNVPVEFRRYLVERETLISGDLEAFRIFSLSVMDSMKIGIRNVQVKSISVETERCIVIFDRISGHLQHFNPRRNTWKKMHKMNYVMMRNDFSAVTLYQYIYVMMQNKSVYRVNYSDEAATWEHMADMLESHGRPVPAVVLGGFIFVVGCFYPETTKSVEKYDPSLNRWTKLQNIPHACQSAAVLASQVLYIYFFGGKIDSSYSGEVKRFNQLSQEWSELKEMSAARSYIAAVEFNEMIYVFGGSNKNGSTHTVMRYDPGLNQWTTLKSMLVGRSWFRVFAINENIYAVGGYTSSPGSIEQYDAERNEWKMVELPSGMKLKILESVEVKLPQ